MSYASVMNSLGLTYSTLSNYTEPVSNRQKGIDAYQAALEYRTSEAAPFEKANVLNNLGYSHYRLGRLTGEVKLLQNALLHFEEALRIRNPETSPLGYSTILNNQGITYSALAELDDPKTNIELAITHLEKALEYRDPQKQVPGNFAITATNLAAIYTERGQISDGEFYARKAISLTEEVRKFRDDLTDRRLTYATRGKAYLLLGCALEQPEYIYKAIELFDDALEAQTRVDISEKYFSITRSKIEALLALRPDQECLETALNLCRDVLEKKNLAQFPVISIRFSELLGDCLEATGDRAEANARWKQSLTSYKERQLALDVDRVQAKLESRTTD